jgi:hypothetical protein
MLNKKVINILLIEKIFAPLIPILRPKEKIIKEEIKGRKT